MKVLILCFKNHSYGLCCSTYFKAEKHFLFWMRKMSREFPHVKNSQRMCSC